MCTHISKKTVCITVLSALPIISFSTAINKKIKDDILFESLYLSLIKCPHHGFSDTNSDLYRDETLLRQVRWNKTLPALITCTVSLQCGSSRGFAGFLNR